MRAVAGGVAARSWALALAFSLVGCAAPAPKIDGPVLSGRMAVLVDAGPDSSARNDSAGFELRGDASQGELTLQTPLGMQLAQARWQPGRVTLRTGAAEQAFASLEDLSEQVLGQRLPLAAWPDWLAGRPWPGAPSRDVEDGFEQLGWRLDLSRRGEGRLVASRDSPPPRVTLRVVLDR